MTHLLNPTIRLLETDPEVKSYIYQQIAELEAFVTEDTIVSVIARDPRKLAIQLETDGKEIPLDKLRKMHRVAIVLKEGDTQIQEEGLHENVFEAIRAAKNALLQRLAAIQDQVITNQDRMAQINDALQNNQLH
jgi:ribosome-associated translation inhibitor RaiA